MVNLNPKEKEKLQKIWDADYQTIHNGKDNGVPFLRYLFELHFKIFGEVCSHCPSKIAGYIQKLKKINPEKMKKSNSILSNFKLNEGVIIPVQGTSQAYSNGNLTDEIAVELLVVNPKRKALFAKLPKNVDELIKNYKPTLEVVKDDDKKNGNVDLVVIGEHKITIEQALDLLSKVKVATKATTVAGINKVINALEKESLADLLKLSEIKAPEVPEIKLSREDLEFELEKAHQDLDELKQDPEKNVDQIEVVEATILSLVEKLAE